MHEIYLDHAATTPVHPDVLGLMLPFFGNHFGIPDDPSRIAERPGEAVREARSRAARLTGADPREIIFTSGGTEAANMAVLGAARAMKTGHIITSAIEHPSVLNACRRLETEGYRVTYVPVTSAGMVEPGRVKEAIRDDTILISIMHVNHEVGTIQPIPEIGAIAKTNGIPFHSDAAQSAGKIPVNVNEMQADLLSFSSHKLYGPKGAGALYIRQGIRIIPVMLGEDQEKGLRPGTLNVPAIVGFGKACEIAGTDLRKNAGIMHALRDTLEKAILEKITGSLIHGSAAPRAPHISSLSIPGIPGDALSAWLHLEGITASAGASLFSRKPSHVLTAMGIPAEAEFGTIRFSTGWENTGSEIKTAVEAVEHAALRLREFSSQVEDGMSCIVTFPHKDVAGRAVQILKDAGLTFAVTVRPVELSLLKGTPIAVAISCSEEGRAGSILGEHGVGFTGMHRLKGLCRQRSREEERFWEKVSRLKKGID